MMKSEPEMINLLRDLRDIFENRITHYSAKLNGFYEYEHNTTLDKLSARFWQSFGGERQELESAIERVTAELQKTPSPNINQIKQISAEIQQAHLCFLILLLQ
mmetsp:Transcript_6768/g.8456  ORF Transcript_6768/g.8456 Transcript_6768/m.8456 type:complete len:103 (+) Transcript_6768:240-548(+)